MQSFGVSSESQRPSLDVLERIITKDEVACEMIEWAEIVGSSLSRQLTSSQIRSIFSEVRTIEGIWRVDDGRGYRRLILLKPKMAYRAKREIGRGVQELVNVLSPAIDYVQGNGDNFRRFVEFFESILAYHKAYGGR